MDMKLYLIMVLIYVSLMISDIEHLFKYLFIGHLYIFFAEISTQVLCPFKNWVCLFVVELQEFFIYFGY